MTARDSFILLLASRQCGKSSAASVLVYQEMVRGGFVLATAPTERQAVELGRKVEFARHQDPYSPRLIKGSQTEIELAGGGRFVVLPSDAKNIRGFSSATLLVFDEAGFMQDETITALMPSRGDRGKIVMLPI